MGAPLPPQGFCHSGQHRLPRAAGARGPAPGRAGVSPADPGSGLLLWLCGSLPLQTGSQCSDPLPTPATPLLQGWAAHQTTASQLAQHPSLQWPVPGKPRPGWHPRPAPIIKGQRRPPQRGAAVCQGSLGHFLRRGAENTQDVRGLAERPAKKGQAVDTAQISDDARLHTALPAGVTPGTRVWNLILRISAGHRPATHAFLLCPFLICGLQEPHPLP